MRRVVKLSHGHATCTHGVMFSTRSGRCRGFSDEVFFCICCGFYHHHGVADRRVQSHDVRKSAWPSLRSPTSDASPHLTTSGKHGCTFSDFNFLIQIKSISDLKV